MIKNIKAGELLSLSFLLLSISQMLTLYEIKSSIYTYLIYPVPFLSISILLFFFYNKISRNKLSLILLGISIIATLLNHISNYTGLILFLISLSVSIKSMQTYIIYGVFYITTLFYNLNTNEEIPSRILVYISGMLIISILFKEYCLKSKEAFRIDLYNEDVDDYIIKATIYYIEGYPWDKNPIAIDRNITGKYLRDQITKQYKEMGFNNITQFAYYIGIMQNQSKLEK